MSLQFVLETVTGTPLDVLIQDDFTAPLGMVNSGFHRGNIDITRNVAVTEYQVAVLGPTEPARPQPVWGTVIMTNLLVHCLLILA